MPEVMCPGKRATVRHENRLQRLLYRLLCVEPDDGVGDLRVVDELCHDRLVLSSLA